MNASSFGIHRVAPKADARAGKSLNSLNKVRPRPQVAAQHSQSRLGDSLVSKSSPMLFPILHQQLNSKRRPQQVKRLVLLMKRHTYTAPSFSASETFPNGFASCHQLNRQLAEHEGCQPTTVNRFTL
ncbi:hypothetical protein CABS03_02297 [Colletotrichum abscissum]|uniref:Uncharacterized protein n=1 Tax=Colletotrichum abscissum TaxID=1671311 RepID=A0A9Q0AXJ6_9PEZI|nr:hypothetical protein CABS02_13814 [Colletotrichum abscissum]